MNRLTKSTNQDVSPVRRPLSVELTGLLEEAKALISLKGEWGRMPNGSVKDRAIKDIDEWFKGSSAPSVNNRHLVSIKLRTLREIWELCGEQSSLKFCKDFLADISEFTDNFEVEASLSHVDSVSDDDGIPF